MLRQKDLDAIYKLAGCLVNEVNLVNSNLIQDTNGLNALQVLDLTTSIVSKKFEEVNSHYKRSKLCESNLLYVAPKEIAVGSRFELEKSKKSHVAIPRRIQSTYQYVSIVETIQSLFKREDFKECYFKFNSNIQSEHKCVDGVFKHFCCGQKYKSTELFQTNTNSIQIQIATDDFEPCNPLQSKSGSHKICAVYFVVRNMPTKFLSKLNNIYLICLCNSNDLKSQQTDFNDIWSLIVKEMKYVENVGVDIGSNITIKGSISFISYDNLGGNCSLGFVESFQSFFYCRICELSKAECQRSVKEDPKMLRNKEKYMKQIAIIDESEKVNYSQTRGIKRFCLLNDLKYFHITQNISVDPMHDLNEGVIPFVMKHFIERCISLKIFSKKKIIQMIKFHDFGALNSKNRPSQLELDKKNMGQNASQSMCLFLHLPFILWIYRNDIKLKEMWICVESLLRICQIVYSSEIAESDLVRLENQISIHLKSIQKIFKVKLIPKHHLLTHYCTVIRQMGPVIHMSMMRFENKHKFFKNNIKRTSNFMNPNKSLALHHQAFICKQENTYRDDIETGAKLILTEEFFIDNARIFANNNIDTDGICEVKWLRCNGITFKKGLLVLNGFMLFEIVKILSGDDGKYKFFCKKNDVLGFDRFSNSLEIERNSSNDCILINFDKSVHKKTYECKKCLENFYLIADTLEIESIIRN